METNLKGKVVIVTGAGKGIGHETAKVFYKLGCKVAVISRSEKDLISLKKELDADSEDFFYATGDVSQEKTVNSFVLNVYKKFGKIDCLINNAGVRFRKKFTDITYAEWQSVMNVNVGSVMLMSQAVIPFMIEKNHGRIINMASIIGTLGLADLSGYAASKGAIISLTKALAVELAVFNINVNAIAPGLVKDSPVYNRMTQDFREVHINASLTKTLLTEEELTDMFITLISQKNLNGQIIHLNGGQYFG